MMPARLPDDCTITDDDQLPFKQWTPSGLPSERDACNQHHMQFTGCRRDRKAAKVCSTRVMRTPINVGSSTRIMCATSAQHVQTGGDG